MLIEQVCHTITEGKKLLFAANSPEARLFAAIAKPIRDCLAGCVDIVEAECSDKIT